MPITAESFTAEHFDALSRGIAVAKEAYESLASRVETLQDDLDEVAVANEEVAELRAECNKRPPREHWEELLECVEDVRRRIRTGPELFALADRLRQA